MFTQRIKLNCAAFVCVYVIVSYMTAVSEGMNIFKGKMGRIIFQVELQLA